ncbi:MAG: DUF4149 domain-containing protein [Campylobacterota bacterium]|nr:DUF4149 domain-containing protein [Campylobacterota bacterium]
MKNKQMIADIIYLILIASTLGGVLVLGIFVAPVVFNTTPLERYQEGIIMAEIFSRFTYWLYAMLIGIVLYEGWEYKKFKRDRIMIASSLMSIFTILMFNTVYTPKILALQALGEEATLSEEFSNLHMASEIDFKLLAVSLIVLFVRRYYLITHPQP